MLAAAPIEEARSLKTFQLALMMVKGARPVPESLAAYFNEVLTQARTLASDPKSADRFTLPEAIQLALDMREQSVLRDALLNISDLQNMSPSAAEGVLVGLERPLAAQH